MFERLLKNRKQVWGSYSIYIDQFLLISLALGFIIQQVTDFSWLRSVLSILVLAIILLQLPKIRGTILFLSSGFLIIGIMIMLYQQVSIQEWQQATLVNVTLVTLFVFAPMFGIPVRSPVYVNALKRFYQISIKGSGAFFIVTQLLTQMLAVFLNVGSISVVHHLASIHRSSGSWRIISNALNRGFASAILWSPYFAAMAVVTHALHINWIELLPYVVGFCLLSFCISFLVELPYLREKVYEEETAAMEEEVHVSVQEEQGASKKLVPLALYLLMAMTLILIVEQVVNVPIVIIISLVALLYPMLWCIGSRSFSFYKQGVRDHVTKNLPALKKEIVLFLTAGFFSGAIAQTNVGEGIPNVLARLPIPLPIVFTIGVLLLIVLTSSIGLHPIILTTIFATTIDSVRVGITPVFFAVLLLGSWSISNIISPATAVNSLVSTLVKKDVFALIKVNYVYTVILLVVLPVYLFVIGI